MSRPGDSRRVGPTARLALMLGLAVAGSDGPAMAQDGPITTMPPTRPIISTPAPSAPASAPAGIVADAPGTASAIDGPAGAGVDDETTAFPSDVQVVRFQGPAGMTVEVVGPSPEAAPQGDGRGLLTTGLKVGVGYRLRLANLPDRPGVELFPVIEVVGHLHRPGRIDPGKFPIRVAFDDDDLTEAADHGRLVTRVVYLEDPDQAVPMKLGKDDPPAVTLSPAEEPLKVATALGRVMAIVRIGGRKPVAEEFGMPLSDGLARPGCPFTDASGGRCGLPCGPVAGTAPPAGRPWLPKDEYLCDGGDRAMPTHFAGDGGLQGIDPRDAVVKFSDDRRPRILPTNTVCIYAPRFASVRVSIGANESLNVQGPVIRETIEREAQADARQGPRRLAQNVATEINRHRSRASAQVGRVYAGEKSELRVLSGYDASLNVKGHVRVEGPVKVANRVKAVGNRETIGPVVLKRGTGVVMTGVVEGGGQMVMSWTPRETVGVETPPDRPGISVVKQVSVDQAEPGDEVTYTITYRNMGNTPLRSVSIVDSLQPRLEYVPKSAMGPAGTVFSSGENRVGSLELRWDLPGLVAPGTEGTVSFRAIVR